MFRISRDVYYILTIVILASLLVGAGSRIQTLDATLAARPAISDKVVTKIVRGPVRIEIRTITKPDGTKETSKVLARAGEEIDRNASHSEVPACAPPERRYDRYLGVLIDPLSATKINGARGSMTVLKRVEVGANLRYDRGLVAGGDLGWRF